MVAQAGFAAAVLSIASALLAGVALLLKLWHEPRFVAGVLPAPGEDTSGLSSTSGGRTAQRTRYRRGQMLRDREYSRDGAGMVSLPVLIQNQGHGVASSLTATIEFDTDAPEVLNVYTEALIVDAVFGGTQNLADRLKPMAADRRIREAYARIGSGGTYVEMVGSLPAHAVEMVVLEIRTDDPLDLVLTIRLQTPQRILQHAAIHQVIRVR